MPPAPPRRPRRWWWSWACTAVVVQVVGVFALAAMVAWPERHYPFFEYDFLHQATMYVRFSGRDGDRPRVDTIHYGWSDLPPIGLRLLEKTRGAAGPLWWGKHSRNVIVTEERWGWRHRDRGVNVPFRGLPEWLFE